MGKVRISATINKETEKRINEFLENSKFRNKSHLIEEALIEFLDKEEKKK